MESRLILCDFCNEKFKGSEAQAKKAGWKISTVKTLNGKLLVSGCPDHVAYQPERFEQISLRIGV